MRTQAPLLIAVLLSGAAFATEASVNAADDRKPIAPSAYNGDFGDEAHQAQMLAAYGINLPSGELARVALLGTFGQKNVTGQLSEAPLPPAQPGAAIAMYTNYDGQGSRFGDTSIRTQSSNPLLSVFASFDLDAKVTVVLLNKSAMVADAVVLDFKGMGQKGAWRAFELSPDGCRIVAAGNGMIYDAELTRTVQPYSALLIEFRPVGGILPIRTPAPADAIPAALNVEEKAAPAPMGCSAAEAGMLSLSLLALLGVMRRRSQY